MYRRAFQREPVGAPDAAHIAFCQPPGLAPPRKEPLMSDSQTETRTRTITWEDPLPIGHVVRSMSDIANLRALVSGQVPPPLSIVLLGMRLSEIEEGRAVFSVEPTEYHYNPLGVVHGGLAAAMLDSVMGCAVHSLLPAGTVYTTLEFKVNFVRALTREAGEARCEGKVIHHGSRIATAEGRITDASGKLYAHTTATCLILRPEAGS